LGKTTKTQVEDQRGGNSTDLQLTQGRKGEGDNGDPRYRVKLYFHCNEEERTTQEKKKLQKGLKCPLFPKKIKKKRGGKGLQKREKKN